MKQTAPKSVMLIDDSSIDNFITTRMIEQSELTKDILVMESSRKALHFLKEHQTNLQDLPDLIFLDLNMPVVDGFDFLSEFSLFPEKIKSKCQIVVLTSSDKTEDIHTIINNRLVKRYLIKPLSIESLDDLRNLFK